MDAQTYPITIHLTKAGISNLLNAFCFAEMHVENYLDNHIGQKNDRVTYYTNMHAEFDYLFGEFSDIIRIHYPEIHEHAMSELYG